MTEILKKAARSTLLGLLLALIIGGPLCDTTQAMLPPQIVHDPISLTAHIRQWAEDLQEWLETVDFYTRTTQGILEANTSLKGVLTTVEKQLGFNKKMLQTISDIGKTIRSAYRIKTLIQSLIQGRMSFLARIHDRLANGIFDLDRDARDLQEYFEWELGQVSERTLGDIERIEEYDSTLQMLKLEIIVRKKRIAEAEESAKRSEEMLQDMRDDPENVTQLDIQQAQLEADQRNYTTQLARDREELLELQREEITRRERIGKDVIESRRFGRQIDDMNKAWHKMTEQLNKLRINPTGDHAPSN